MNITLLLRMIGAGALALALVLGLRAALFVSKAAHADGTVETVTARDDRCSRSSGGKHHITTRYDCTRYSATVAFAYAGSTHQVTFDAGKHKGHGASTADADVHEGEHVQMTFAPGHPDDAFQGGNASLHVWGLPLLALLIGGVLLFVSFARNRTR